MEFKVKYLDEEMPKIKNVEGKKSDWIDLMSKDEVTLKKGEFAIINLGVCIACPEGYEAWLLPRSSLFKKHGLIQTNSMGIIDETYCGDNDVWGLAVYATRDTKIDRFERICQFRFVKHQPECEPKEVAEMLGPDRGGFGSTGSS